MAVYAPPLGFGGGLGGALIKRRRRRPFSFFPNKLPTGLGQAVLSSIPTGPFGFTGTEGGPTGPGGPGNLGGNPYSGLINQYLNQSRADLAAESVADAASRDAALRKLIVSYGDVPNFEKLGISPAARGFLEKALDPRTRELALANTREGTSIKARQEEANQIAMRRIPALLAATGRLRSGQTGYDLGQQGLLHKRTVFDTLNELLGSAEGTIGNFLNAERERQRMLADLAMEAAMNAAQDFGGSLADLGDPGNVGNINRWLGRFGGRGLRGAGFRGRTYKPFPRFTRPGQVPYGSAAWFPFGSNAGGGL